MQGRVIGTADAWIAATALLNNVPLVSHNRRDFEKVTGLKLISEA
jgi:predicted nucleic acid-binding protein